MQGAAAWPCREVELYVVCKTAEEKVEGDVLLAPSPSQSAYPMGLDPAPVGLLAPSVPAGDETIPKQTRLGSDLTSGESPWVLRGIPIR